MVNDRARAGCHRSVVVRRRRRRHRRRCRCRRCQLIIFHRTHRQYEARNSGYNFHTNIFKNNISIRDFDERCVTIALAQSRQYDIQLASGVVLGPKNHRIGSVVNRNTDHFVCQYHALASHSQRNKASNYIITSVVSVLSRINSTLRLTICQKSTQPQWRACMCAESVFVSECEIESEREREVCVRWNQSFDRIWSTVVCGYCVKTCWTVCHCLPLSLSPSLARLLQLHFISVASLHRQAANERIAESKACSAHTTTFFELVWRASDRARSRSLARSPRVNEWKRARELCLRNAVYVTTVVRRTYNDVKRTKRQDEKRTKCLYTNRRKCIWFS